ncbi:MAG: hypothetical protein ACI3XO_00215 [Eubacteriales bacterium]
MNNKKQTVTFLGCRICGSPLSVENPKILRPTEIGMVYAYNWQGECRIHEKKLILRGGLKQVAASIARLRIANGSPFFLISQLFFLVDYLPEQIIVRHDSVLLIRRGKPRHFPRWGRLFVTENSKVQFSELRINDVFSCIGCRTESISLPQWVAERA